VTEITDTPSNRSVGQRVGPQGLHPALRLALPLALMAGIFYFSAQSYDGAELAWWEVFARKLGHFTGYLVLALAWAWALEALVDRPRLWAAAISFAYACSDEYHQTFVDGRTGKVLDVGIDTLGIAAALLLVAPALLRRRRARG
jgi:VanZ family protein